MTLDLTPEFLSYILAGVVAALIDWFPTLRDWFDLWTDGQKKLIMAGILGVIVALIYAAGCVGWITNLTCDQLGLQRLVSIYLISIGINQGVHKLTKRDPAADIVAGY
jgi:hypothetical protein